MEEGTLADCELVSDVVNYTVKNTTLTSSEIPVLYHDTCLGKRISLC
jgi:hypothetical protein